MYARILSLDNHDQSVFLFGPRGTGKTSWLKTHFPGALYFDLLHSATYVELLGNPSLLDARIPTGYSQWIILDEIQKIPELLNEVHRLIEHKRYKFILTGSSARALRKKGVNLLAGRALTSHMHPLIATEIGKDFDLKRALNFGLLPMAYTGKQPKRYLATYVQTYLNEEVQQEALTRNITLFARFLTAASFSQGSVLNYTEIAREVGTTRQTITTYFEILEDLLIGGCLPVFNKRAKRELVVQNKFYYFDVGVFLSIRPRGPLDRSEEILGPGIETLFLQHARAINDYYYLNYTIYYWRTRTQLEVDFVMYGEKGLLAFEIKHASRLHSKDFKGLLAFKADYPMAQCYLIYGGLREYIEHDVTVIPLESLLFQLPELLGA